MNDSLINLMILITFGFLIIITAGAIVIFLFIDYEKDKSIISSDNYYFSNNRSNFGEASEITSFIPQNSNHFPGSLLTVNTCNNINNAIWSSGKCYCNPGWYGNRCNIEKFSNKYLSLGSISKNNIQGEFEDVYADGKSFTENSCSKSCDKNSECTGFYYKKIDDENYLCSLLKSDASLNNYNLVYNLENESSLYLKNNKNLKINNYVYLTNTSLPLRFWLMENNENFYSLKIGNQVNLFFTPKIAHSNGRYGIYTNYKFDPKLYKNNYHEINTGRGIYVHKPDKQLEVPLIMRNSEEGLFITYY